MGLAAVTAMLVIPFNGAPLLAKAIDAGTAIAQNVLKQPKVELHLAAEKQKMQKDEQGKETVTWQAMTTGNSVAQPGDVIRFSIKGENKGNRAAKSLAVTQPIPAGMIYVLNSATPVNRNPAVYSIDGGKTFVAKPVVKITLANGQTEERPAPAEAYTHVRWNLNEALEPSTAMQADYQVKVRS